MFGTVPSQFQAATSTVLASQVSEWMECTHTSCSWRSESFEDMQLCSVMELGAKCKSSGRIYLVPSPRRCMLLKVVLARKKPS